MTKSKAPEFLDRVTRLNPPGGQGGRYEGKGELIEPTDEEISSAGLEAGYGRVITQPLGHAHRKEGKIIVVETEGTLVRGKILSVGPPDERYKGAPCHLQVGQIALYAKNTQMANPKKPGSSQPGVPLIHHIGNLHAVLQVEVVAVEQSDE